MQLPSVYAHNFQLGHFDSNCLSSHGWRWTLAFWPLSWPVTSSLFDLKYWGKTGWWRGLCPLLRGTGFSPKLLLWYPFAVFAANLASHQVNAVLLLCSRAIISILQVWLEKLRCLPFHEVGIAYVSFVLGMKPSVVQYFGLSLSRPIVGSDELCDRAVKLVGSWEFLYVLFNKLDGQSYW